MMKKYDPFLLFNNYKILFAFLFLNIICFINCTSPENNPVKKNREKQEPVLEIQNVKVELPKYEGWELVEVNCVPCHSLRYIEMQPEMSKKNWEKIVYKMIKNFGAPIKDTLIACICETININTALSGGRPAFQKLIIKTEDSAFLQNNLTRKITKNQWVTLYYFDNCYPDTTIKKVYIKMRDPLNVQLNKDSTICYSNKASLTAP